ncbi:hypothetical protein [Legionella sp. WA2022007384]
MLTIKTLKNLLHIYKKQEAIFSSTLDAQTLDAMQQESDYVFFFFNQFTHGDEDTILPQEIISHIRRYFKNRWELLKKSNLVYTRHPFLPANQFCLKIAEVIAGPDEAICQILMPGLVGLNRKGADLKFETETEGHFELENYVINHAYNRLIPVSEVFQMAKVDSNLVIADFQPPENQVVYQLSGRDMLNLEQVAGKASETFIRVLKEHHRNRYDDKSFGFALGQLALELKKASVADSGSEGWADNEVVAGAIKTFYELWRKLPKDISLPEPHKTLISNLCLKSYGGSNLTIKSYLLALFVRHKDCPLTEEEFVQQKAEDIFPCAFQISNCLFEFLNQYPELYKIPIHAEATKAKEDLPSLASLLDGVLKVLAHRPQMLDGDDSGLFSLLIRLVRQSTGYNVFIAADFIAPGIKDYEHFNYLTDTPELFKTVATRAQSRLDKLPYMTKIHKLLSFFSEEQQQVIVESKFSELAGEYNTPEKYQLIMSKLGESVKKSFRQKYAEQIKNHCISFEAWKTHFMLWKSDTAIQELLLEQLFSQFKNNIIDSNVLFDLLKATNEEGRIKLVTEFKSLINTKGLFEKCLGYMSNSSYERFLNLFRLDSFICSLSELQSVATLFPSDKLLDIIFTQFTPEKLNCKEEELTSLKCQLEVITGDEVKKQYHDSLFIWAKSLKPDELEYYITEIIDKKYAPALSTFRLRTFPVKEYLKASTHESGDNRLAYILCSGAQSGALNMLLIQELTPLMLQRHFIPDIEIAIRNKRFEQEISNFTRDIEFFAKNDKRFTHPYSEVGMSLFYRAVYDWVDSFPKTTFKSLIMSSFKKYEAQSWGSMWGSSRRSSVGSYFDSHTDSYCNAKALAMFFMSGPNYSTLSDLIFQEIVKEMKKEFGKGPSCSYKELKYQLVDNFDLEKYSHFYLKHLKDHRETIQASHRELLPSTKFSYSGC